MLQIVATSMQIDANSIQIVAKTNINKIPVISIMETNQFLLHSGRVNNYILPLNIVIQH